MSLGCSDNLEQADQTDPLAQGSSTGPAPTGTPAGSNATPGTVDSGTSSPGTSVGTPPPPGPGTPGVVPPSTPPSPPAPAEPATPGVSVTSPVPAAPPTTPVVGPAPDEPEPAAGGAPTQPEPEPEAVANGGSGGENSQLPSGGSGGMTPVVPLEPGICDNNRREGDETAIDCGGSCPACPGYPSSGPDPENEARSGCEASGTGFMCPQSMVFSSSMKQAVYDDWGSDDPPFVYGVVGHDPDPGGVDAQGASYSSTCCQCYQLVFKGPRDGNVSIPTPKPMVVQAFNTYAGGPTAFDVYMAAGGYGNFNGCTENGRLYSAYPDMGGDWTGGVRATRYQQCAAEMGYDANSVGSSQCQDYVASQCGEIQSSDVVQSISRDSCVQSNRIESHYHMNWNVVVKRVECPESLTKVTGCRLSGQGLPQADPAIQTAAQAMQSGFLDGDYHTTTMQDCCRPTCAWPTNVAGTQGGASHFYVCDAQGNQR